MSRKTFKWHTESNICLQTPLFKKEKVAGTVCLYWMTIIYNLVEVTYGLDRIQSGYTTEQLKVRTLA